MRCVAFLALAVAAAAALTMSIGQGESAQQRIDDQIVIYDENLDEALG